jgi:hypothetical protein
LLLVDEEHGTALTKTVHPGLFGAKWKAKFFLEIERAGERTHALQDQAVLLRQALAQQLEKPPTICLSFVCPRVLVLCTCATLSQ